MSKQVKTSLLFDTHIHFFDKRFKKALTSDFFSAFFEERVKKQVGYFCNVGTDLASSQEALTFAQKYPFLFAAVGVHPSMTNGWTEKSLIDFTKLLNDPKVVAIGEIGLDFYRTFTEQKQQIAVFQEQLKLAEIHQKPVLLHIRDAYSAVLKIIKNYQVKGIVHCFSGSWEDAQTFLKLGFYLSFSGVLTFKNAKELELIAQKTPLERIVLETDAPYLTPHPHRGKINLPEYLLYIAQKLATIKKIPLSEVIKTTTSNACQVFKLPFSD